jgi:hypothetical protein
MVFNTLARALVQRGPHGWEDLFRESERILQQRNRTDLPRTWCYWAHGYLRHGRLGDAAALIECALEHPGLQPLSRWTLLFYKADLARRRGESWTSKEMEEGPEPGRIGLTFAFYLQATARQPECKDSAERFARGAKILRQDLGPEPQRNFASFIAACMELGEAAARANGELWEAARHRLEDYLNARAGTALDFHYREQVGALGPRPDAGAVGKLLDRVPYL